MKPKIQIVDNKDNLIGLKTREEIDSENDIYRVAALWVTNSMREILIAQRKLTKKSNPGKWGPAVAGTVDEGETYDINIYKEAEEEIGLSNVEFVKSRKIFTGKPRKYFCQWYMAVVDRDIKDFVIQHDEVEAIKWISPQALAEDVEANADDYIDGMGLVVNVFSGATA